MRQVSKETGLALARVLGSSMCTTLLTKESMVWFGPGDDYVLGGSLECLFLYYH